MEAAEQKKKEASDKVKLKFDEIKGKFDQLWTKVSEGGGQLPCYSGVLVMGKQFSLCFSQYSQELEVIGNIVLLIAALVSVSIIFRG